MGPQMAMDAKQNNLKTLTIRSPFIIFNKTNAHYALKIEKKQKLKGNDSVYYSNPIVRLDPGQGYPLSNSQVEFAKFYIAQIDDLKSNTNCK